MHDLTARDGSSIVIDDSSGLPKPDGLPWAAGVAEGIKAAGLAKIPPDRGLNGDSGAYNMPGVRVANVFSAFHTPDFGSDVTVAGFGSLHRNVAAICRWTWECAAAPRGPNEHANQVGYQVIAQAFLAAGAG